jgi:hypothetical protein
MSASPHISETRALDARRGRIIRHFGTLMTNLHIIATDRAGNIWDCGPTPSHDWAKVRASLESSVGTPFFGMPGKTPLRKGWHPEYDEIVGRTEHGLDIPRITLETVFNDWDTLNRDHGAGTFESVANFDEMAVLKVALEAYKHLLVEREKGRAKRGVQ